MTEVFNKQDVDAFHKDLLTAFNGITNYAKNAIDGLNNAIDSLKSSNAELKASKGQFEWLKSVNHTINVEIEKVRRQAKDDIEALRAKNIDLQEEISDLRDEVEDLTTEIWRLNNTLRPEAAAEKAQATPEAEKPSNMEDAEKSLRAIFGNRVRRGVDGSFFLTIL